MELCTVFSKSTPLLPLTVHMAGCTPTPAPQGSEEEGPPYAQCKHSTSRWAVGEVTSAE